MTPVSEDSRTPLESRWFVSVPHSVLEEVHGQRVERPYGVIHARESGSGLTACGKYAVGWRIFWELRFRTTDARACPKCIEAVIGVHSGNPGA